ncbi:hypothetical protein [Neptuniibacter sp. QD48_11]|uniref:hypothetical protein n=1 Tax=Neptuniibacter sp. QD48_11 TaxID=3398211 RepID=UPI0039F497D2
MDNFFKGLEIDQPDTEEKSIPRKSPSWIASSKSPQISQQYYDAVMDLYEDSLFKIKSKMFSKASDVILSQSKVCDALGKQRSALKNHPMIVETIASHNELLQHQLDKVRDEQKFSRKTKNQIKRERDELLRLQKERLKTDYVELLKADMVIDQSEALHRIEQLKLEISELYEENAALKAANSKLQDDKHNLEKKLFMASSSMKSRDLK